MRILKKLLIVLLLFIITPTVNAKKLERTESNNYGVNKNFKITEKNKNNVLKTPLVDASKKIHDFSKVLTDDEIEALEDKIKEFTKKTDMDLVIVTVNLPYTIDKENEDYAADFYDYNDFGIDFENYSGVLLLRNTYEKDRYYNAYMFGKAQLYYNLSKIDNVLDDIYSDLSNDNYLEGFSLFIDLMYDGYEKGIPDELKGYTISDNGTLVAPPKVYEIPWKIALIISTIFTAIATIIAAAKHKMVHKSFEAKNYLNKDSFKITMDNEHLLKSVTTHHRISDNSFGGGGSSGGGISSSIGSSGGGHTSGSGRHG